MAVYDIGDAVTFSVAFANAAGTATDPTVASATITRPSGATSAPSLTHGATGAYSTVVTFDEAGLWQVRFTGTGAVTAVEPIYVTVRPLNPLVYVSPADLRSALGTTSTAGDDHLEQAARAASRAIDRYCGRRFYCDATASARTFAAATTGDNADLPVPDIATAAGLVVATDDAASGVFGTTWPTTDYVLSAVGSAAPFNPTSLAVPEPFTGLRALGRWWPRSFTGRPLVSISAVWGWPAVPIDVVQATFTLGIRLYRRKDAPFGITGSPDLAMARLPSIERDPDMRALLDPYKLWSVA